MSLVTHPTTLPNFFMENRPHRSETDKHNLLGGCDNDSHERETPSAKLLVDKESRHNIEAL